MKARPPASKLKYAMPAPNAEDGPPLRLADVVIDIGEGDNAKRTNIANTSTRGYPWFDPILLEKLLCENSELQTLLEQATRSAKPQMALPKLQQQVEAIFENGYAVEMFRRFFEIAPVIASYCLAKAAAKQLWPEDFES